MKVFYISWNDPETVFHEMPWKKNFTGYASLNDIQFSKKMTLVKMFVLILSCAEKWSFPFFKHLLMLLKN